MLFDKNILKIAFIFNKKIKMNVEMQEKVLQDLEETGFLFDMKAMIRGHIYSSVKSQQKEPISKLNSKPKELDSEIGKISCALVADFLQQFGLNLSLKMFLPEAQLENQELSIKTIEQSSNLKSTKNNPLLFEIIDKLFVSQDEEAEEEEGSIPEDIESAQSTERKDDQLVESAGTSQGYDQSVNSLAMEDFDYVEDIKKIR